MRIFISVELPDEIKNKIAKLIDKLKKTDAKVKWVKPENLHITLKFLGWVDDSKIDEIINLTTKAAAQTKSFKAKFVSIGSFPEGRKPRVVWVGTAEGGDELCSIAQALEETFGKAGYKTETRAFKSHITIGRVKESKVLDKLVKEISGLKSTAFGEMSVNSINIMKSTLRRDGPIYEILKGVKL